MSVLSIGKRRLFVYGLTFVFVSGLVATTRLAGQGGGNAFVDHSDNGETLHVLPPAASVRSPRDTQPTIAPSVPGLSVYAPSYGSGNLTWHGGPQMNGAGFFAVYWNSSVANASGKGVTSLGYTTLQAELSDFVKLFADNADYSPSDASADFTVVQQYGVSNNISSVPLSPVLTSLGYFVDNQPAQASISDAKLRSYLASVLDRGAVPVSTQVIYGIYLPPGMKVTLQGGASCRSFCGYHGNFAYNGKDIKYAAFPYLNCSACMLSGLSVADMMTIVTSHEIREAVTDPDLNAWYDGAGYEADDKCAWHNLYQTATGSFWVQPEFSNGGTVTASGFTATYPQLSPTAGACVVAR
ncbi:MAG TPA: hypothetical protein VFP91_17315 [Vicinamibacterales bacterium]|nr:hypothetical protein [Vicinamibacterales bacterium]